MVDRNDPKFNDPTFDILTQLVVRENMAFWQALVYLDIPDGSNQYLYYHELLEEWFGRPE